MMREIKFRGKRVDNGEWVYGDLLNCYSGDKRIIWDTGNPDENHQENNHIVHSDSVGQMSMMKTEFTKEEVFEGDVCIVGIRKPRSHNYHGSNDIVSDFKCVVEYDYDSLVFKNLDKGKAWKAWHTKRLGNMDISTVKKTGNSYDNPELIN